MLSHAQARVVGALAEKQLTTPQQYPLTLLALVSACNQPTNRDPVVDYTEDQVTAVLEELREDRLVRFVLPSHGRSVVRYRHVLDETFALDTGQLAVVAVLLLRGPQTAGELRARTDRMADYDSIGAVEGELERLAAWEPPLVARQARRPGQKEDRWTELLRTHGEDGARESPRSDDPASHVEHAARGPFEEVPIREAVAALREEVAQLRHALEELRSSLGG